MTSPVTATTSIDAAATQSPWSRNVISVPNGDLVLIYQSGAGLKMKVSTDAGATWAVSHDIDSKTDVYASAVINLVTYDIHVVYSKRGNPSTDDESVYYRPLIRGTSDWSVGAEEILAGSNSINDYATAGRRNATISVGADGYLVVTYLRNEGGIVTWAALIGNAIWTTSGFDSNSNVGLQADVGSRGAGLQTSTRTLWFLSRTGSSYSLSYQTAITVLADVDLLVTDSSSGAWLGDAGEHFAFVYAAQLNQIGVVYLKASNPYLRLYSVATGALISETKLSSSTCQSVSITWDGERFWMAWVSSDTVSISASDAPTSVLTTVSSGGSEGWSWLNAPIDASFHLFVWSQTNGSPSNVYSGQKMPQAITFVAEDTGAGIDSIVNIYLPNDTGTGVEVAIVIVRLDATDSGTGSDDVVGGPIASDSGVGTDHASITVPVAAETGVGNDDVSVLFTAEDTAQGVDTASVVQLQSADDSGTGTDSVNQLLIAVADNGLGVDAGNSQLLLVVETAIGQEVVVVIQTVDDSGTSTDAIVMYPTVHDSGVGADDAPVTKVVTDTGQGTDVASLQFEATDSGAAVDGFKLTITVIDNAYAVDSGGGNDPAVTVITTPDRVRLLMTSGRVRLKVE
jgi:hypothetical protein